MIGRKIINSRRFYRTAALVFIGVAVIVFCLWIYLWDGKSASGPVIGDLGGVPVAIPKAYARFMEYDQDPHFLEKKWWHFSPERTYQSRLRGFGFEVRYPDMASVEEQTQEEKDIHTTMWMRVVLNTGEHYGVDESLENHKNYYLDTSRPCFSKCFIYVPLLEKTHGLIGYTPTGSGVDVEERSINFGRGTDLRDRNIYFYEDESGRVTTFIECNNRTHAATRCSQYFNLSPVMKAHIHVNYRKALLPHWQQIQQSVTELIYNFKADTTHLIQSR